MQSADQTTNKTQQRRQQSRVAYSLQISVNTDVVRQRGALPQEPDAAILIDVEVPWNPFQHAAKLVLALALANR